VKASIVGKVMEVVEKEGILGTGVFNPQGHGNVLVNVDEEPT